MISLAIFILLLFLYSLVSGRLERRVVTAPIVFTVAGMLMFPGCREFSGPGKIQTSFSALLKSGW